MSSNQEHIPRLRGDPALPPDASLVIPVNARNDLANVLRIIHDITLYRGERHFEIVLVVNNYPPDSPPKAIEELRAMGLVALAIPKLDAPKETIFAARIPGLRAASLERTIHFDADCRILDATALLDWYVAQFEAGAQLAYTYVGYYDLPASLSARVWITFHRAFRWIKRVILRIPVSRGSNYAVLRSLVLPLYDKGLLSYDIKVGPTIKSLGGKIVYSGKRSLTVLTSGRNFRGDWSELFGYFSWRMGYYRRLSPLRPDKASRPKRETRTMEQIRAHYEIEKELAARLRNASRAERRALYSSLYDELFRRVPHHPQLTPRTSLEKHTRLLERFLDKDAAFLEVGAGDCALSLAAAAFAGQVYAVDVSAEVAKIAAAPGNFHLVLSDGCSIPVPGASITVAYSNQLMEHLHPEDALEQLRNIFAALAPGGIYICITPNRLNGPHDISMYFDEAATGFHLKEYTITELSRLFRAVGFSKVSVYFWRRGIFLRLPTAPFVLFERLLAGLPARLTRRVFHEKGLGGLLYIRMIAEK